VSPSESRPSLDPEDLIAAARAQSGLADFGGDGFREGLGVLCAALAREGKLTASGRAGVAHRIRHLLATRLGIVDWRARHPEIAAQPVENPIFVVGLPRTGTTALAQLLAQDPETRGLRTWESQQMLPPPEAATQHSDPRIAQARAGMDALCAAYPEWPAMYDGGATHTTECEDLLALSFHTWHFCGEYWIPSYDDWLRRSDATQTYRFHRRALELLHWRCGPRRWMLHAPIHTLELEALHRIYPDARFVITHRDPVPVIASACSIIGFVRGFASEKRDPIGLGREQLAMWTDAMQALVRFRERHPSARFADLQFRDLNADPIGTLENCYAQLELPFTGAARERCAKWAADHRRGRRGRHGYRLEDYGLDPHQVRAAFAPYLERFAPALELN
jgi:hypothetical protein